MRFTGIEDLDSKVKLTGVRQDGSTFELVVTKNLKLGYQDKLNPEIVEHVILRDFDFGSPASLIFNVNGGIGDVFWALDAILALKREIAKRGLSDKFQFLATSRPGKHFFAHRFFEALPVFEKYVTTNDMKQLPITFPPRLLDATPWDIDEASGIGTSRDIYWMKWGVPGSFTPSPVQSYFGKDGFSGFDNFEKAVDRHMQAIHETYPNFPKNGSYVFLNPEAVAEGEKKSWPINYWHQLLKWILANTDLNVVLNAVTPPYKEIAEVAASPRVFLYDYLQAHKDLGPKNILGDLLCMVSIIYRSRAVVSLDTGASNIAGSFGKPCIALFGPTHAHICGHPGNMNLRVSTCSPCFATIKRELCNRNVCMEELLPAYVTRAIERLLTSKASILGNVPPAIP